MCIGRLAGKTFHRPEQLSGQVSVCRGVKSRAEQKHGEDRRVEIQMSLELGFAAMRVVLRSLTGNIPMDMLTF